MRELKSMKERIFQYIEYKNIKKNEFERNINASNGYLNSMRKGLGVDKIELVQSCYPDLNIAWLKTGKGPMLKDAKPKYNEAVFIENANIMMIPIVSQYAYAGYTHGYSDAEYVESLPKMPFCADHEAKGYYIGFEVKGDSMDNGSKNSIEEGDMLACRLIKHDLWQYKLHINKWFFVIVHKTEGVLVKQITEHNTESGIIKMHSLNPFYEDREINLKDVAQLFNVVQILRTPRI